MSAQVGAQEGGEAAMEVGPDPGQVAERQYQHWAAGGAVAPAAESASACG